MIWLDANLSRRLCAPLTELVGHPVESVNSLGFKHVSDRIIFLRARESGAIIATKDSDFLIVQAELGFPPPIIHLMFGNMRNSELLPKLAVALQRALVLIEEGETVVIVR